MSPVYAEFEDREKQRVANEIILDMQKMELYELETLKSVSSNMDMFRSFLNGLRFFSGIRGL